jgi:hypothetical protein
METLVEGKSGTGVVLGGLGIVQEVMPEGERNAIAVLTLERAIDSFFGGKRRAAQDGGGGGGCEQEVTPG